MRWAGVLLLGVIACQRPAVPTSVDNAPASLEPIPVAAQSKPLLEYEQRWVGGAVEGDSVPVIVAVHGLGDEPRNFAWVVDGWSSPARVVLPRAPTSFGRGFAWMTVRSAEGRDEELATELAASAARVATLCDALAADPTTKGKPVVTGFSQGGMISYAVAVRHPESVAGAVPVSGWLPRRLWPTQGATVARVRALHGDADTVIGVAQARDTVAHLESAGADARLQVFPGVGHKIPREVRQQMESRVTELAAP